ncbi:MAG TPA: SDR family NAD(P)-dependent oxidoreductase [Lacipirellulaceae bacterium]|jgi:short-subunit dehydrogenase
MSYWQSKRALITGGSSGFGRALAAALVERGARVAIVARGQEALTQAAAALSARGGEVLAIAADVTNAAEFERAVTAIRERWGGVDFFCHAAGRSMRGDVLTTSPDEFRELWELNFLSAVRGTQLLAESLCENRGHLVLIGSLASKVAPRYMGGYPASKFPLAALSQQLRLEIGPRGTHVLLVCPGPIAGDHAAPRYASASPTLPAAAQRPGGGANVKAIDPNRLAAKILRACERRQPELIVPARARALFALSQLSPALGDWLLGKFMAK